MVAASKSATANRLRPDQAEALKRSFGAYFEAGRPRVIRSYLQFAMEAIVIVEGPHVGEKWRPETQPYARLVLLEYDNPHWIEFVLFGCRQSGKSLVGVVIPGAKTLFDDVENFGCGVPTMDVAADKWRDEYLPTFRRSFPDQLPTSGGIGSRGGKKFEAITFNNGRTLKFLSGSGGAEKRSGVTFKKIGITEADKVDVPSEKSTDPNPIGEIKGVLAAFGDDSKCWCECTVTTPVGYVYRNWLAGSQGEILKPCPHCKTAVRPGREELVGWEDSLAEEDARKNATFICPNCKEIITPDERREMCLRGAIVHRGQTATVDDAGELVVEGPLPPTRVCGIRWAAFDNMFWEVEFIAAKVWRAANPTDDGDEESNEKWVCQYMWAEPWEPDEIDLAPLTIADMKARSVDGTRGVVATGAWRLSGGVDVGKRQLHYAVRDWKVGDGGAPVTSRAFDIDEWPVPSDTMGIREAIFTALCELRDKRIGLGYREADGTLHPVAMTLVDARYQESAVFAFMRDCADRKLRGWMAVLGFGQSEPPGRGSYSHPTKVDGRKILWMGEQCHVRMHEDYGLPYMLINTDHWKTFVRDGYTTPAATDNGALRHHEAKTRSDREIIDEWIKHHRAENRFRKIVPGRGPVDVWRNDARRKNHYLDDDVYACGGGNFVGVRVITRPKPRLTVPVTPMTQPEPDDDRPYLASNRQED